jgi:hypothetical protein
VLQYFQQYTQIQAIQIGAGVPFIVPAIQGCNEIGR